MIPRLLFAFWVACALGGVVMFGGITHADSLSEKVAAYDIPAVYQVFGIAKGTITFPQFSVDADMNVTPNYRGISPRVIRLVAKLTDKIHGDGEDLSTAQQELSIAGTDMSDLSVAVDVFQHPVNYVKQETFTSEDVMQSGSAFAIDEKGYLVTNAHVATIKDNDILSQLTDDYESATDTYANIYDRLGVEPGSDRGYTLNDNIDAYLYEFATLATSTTYFKVLPPSVARTMDDHGVLNDGWSADAAYVGEPYPGKDVALLKLHRRYAIPALDLSLVDPSVGGDVYIVGFPGAANLTSEIENQATFTAGTVSAVRSSDSGDFQVFQTDASTGPGSSGGPVLNASGDVIGILTLGSATDSGGGNFNYFLPVSLIKEALNKANIELDGSRAVTGAYHHSVDLLENGDCAGAKNVLSNLQDSLDSDFINQEMKICVPGVLQNGISGWGVGVFIILIGIGVAYFIWHRQRTGISV